MPQTNRTRSSSAIATTLSISEAARQAYAHLIRHWDVTRLPYDGEADRYFDPNWLCAG